ncbi:hypothetical protein Daus18300_003509 [Diaporthe australafricana]|uniref:Uncharacterized protein n=1 Tax=Diaporthe australafricana TaxID=127596 RepID=A0ABR3XFD1_9PEZI
MSSASPAAPNPPAADVAEDSATSAAAAANQSAGTTTTDGAAISTPTTVVQTDPASAPLPPDNSPVPPSPTTLSNPAPSTLSTSEIHLSSVLQHVSSSSLLQTPSTSTISTSLVPDVQVTSTSSTVVPAPVTGNELSTGAVVGIAIGCTAAGIIIGLLASLILFRRHRHPGRYPQEVVEPPDGRRSFDSRAFTATPLEPAGAASGLDQFLPVPRSDKELAGELQSLGYLVQQHVEDNYHLLPAGQDAGVLGQVLADLGLDDGGGAQPGPARLAAMAVDPKTRLEALQHVIARVIFGSLTVESLGKISMLPPSVSWLVREMAPCEKHMGNPEAISVALTRWRQITAFLLNPRRSERGAFIPEDASLEPQAAQLVVEMDKFLGDFVDEKNREHQKHHLQDVVVECARFGYAIFSQPADFTWKFGAGAGSDIVVCPGMEKVSDSQGVRCQPEMMISPEVHRV